MHTPVLLKEVLEYLNPKPGDKIIDATFGAGGHALALAEKVGPSGKMLGIETTKELCEMSKVSPDASAGVPTQSRREGQPRRFGRGPDTKSSGRSNVELINDSYVNLKNIIVKNNFGKADGILFDLGLSSWHLEQSGRGFSFQREEPLDMNFSSYQEIQNSNVPRPYANGGAGKFQNKTAGEVVNKYSEEDLAGIFKEYGEERFAKAIAREIVRTRKDKPIKTTLELVEVIKNAVPGWYQHKKIHFATKVFQALRIEVNNEFENIKTALEQLPDILAGGGRVVVISFHAGEDRIVKNFFRDKAKEGVFKILTKKPVVPTREEAIDNPRARSAKLRAAQLN